MKRRLFRIWLLSFAAMSAMGIRSPLFGLATESTPAEGLTGSTQVSSGVEVVIYTIGLTQPAFHPLNDSDVGNGTINLGVELTIDDLSAPTDLVSSDFTSLKLYRSTDNVFDGSPTDFLLATNTTVNIGAITVLDALNGGGSRTLTHGAEDFLIVTTTISSSAKPGHAFRVGAAANHVGLVETGVFFPAGDYRLGSPIAAADGSNIVIAAQSPSCVGGGGSGVGIPFGGEPVILILLLGTGLYMIRRAAV